MSVEFHSTSKDTSNFYGKMKDEESINTVGSTKSNPHVVIGTSLWKTNLATGRYNTILIGILILLNVAVVALVITELATTAADNVRPPSAQVGMLTSDSATIERLIEIAKGNRNLTMGVQKSIDTDVIQILTSIRSSMGWKKSGNVFYKTMTGRSTYRRAKAKCRSMGGTLAAKVLRDKTVVWELIADGLNPSDPNSRYWIGFDDINTEGEWRWVDGGETNNATTQWLPGEPNQSGGNEDCAHIAGLMDNRLLLNDAPCTTYLPYMCEIEVQKPT